MIIKLYLLSSMVLFLIGLTNSMLRTSETCNYRFSKGLKEEGNLENYHIHPAFGWDERAGTRGVPAHFFLFSLILYGLAIGIKSFLCAQLLAAVRAAAARNLLEFASLTGAL